jgi:hypothetical protein
VCGSRLVALPTTHAFWVGLFAVDAGPFGGAVCHGASVSLRRARVRKDGFSVAFGMRRVAQPCVDELCGDKDGGGESAKLPSS